MMNPNEIIKKPGRLCILAVDDNPSALYATARVLKSAGYEVLQATTGAEALSKAAAADLIVLDVNLPDMDGFEVCRQLRARADTAQLPVLHLSATFTQSGDFELGVKAGADGYLTRPVETPVLIATVRTLLFAKHAEAQRRGLDAQFRTMFELAPVSIAILDEEFTYTNVNPAYCALTGYSAQELIGKPVSYSLEEPVPLVTELAQTPADAVGRWTRRVRFVKKDGSIAEVEWHAAQENISSARILVASDITERIRIEQARESLLASERAARAEAERSNRLKEEFLATLSHELRNPLHSILGWSTILNRTPNLPEPVRRGLQSIERNAQTQTRMTSDLLDHAGIAFGRIRCVPENIDPYPVVRAALDVISTVAASGEVRIRATLESSPLRVEADPARLQQIVLNLLSNAVKFSPRGSEIQLTAGRVDESFTVVVADRGKGIEPQFLPRIFERFSQQDASTTKTHGGLGLGLAIVKQLVELHGGNIEASSPGKGLGATFRFSIPLGAPLVPGVGDSQKRRTLDFSRIVALIVDDDADSRALTARVLKDVGATVYEADCAEAGRVCVATAKPSLLISDIGMAALDGYELLKGLREEGYTEMEMPAIALTAYSRMEDRAQALAAGFQEHLVKPLDPQLLISTVAALCKNAGG